MMVSCFTREYLTRHAIHCRVCHLQIENYLYFLPAANTAAHLYNTQLYADRVLEAQLLDVTRTY
jgi:hypothetical protein